MEGRTQGMRYFSLRAFARKSSFRQLHQLDCRRMATCAKKSLVPSGKSAADFRTSRPDEEGRFAIVTSVGQVIRWTRCVAADAHDPEKCVAVFRKDHAQTSSPTNGTLRTVKSRGPGIPVLMPSSWLDERTGDGGKNAGPQGERV